MTAVAETLDALGHPPGALAEPRLLGPLFARFQAQVPLRREPQGAGPQALLAAWLEEGAGCCGAARVETFAALATAAGYRLVEGEARHPDGEARRVLVSEDGRLLLDAAFPLPAPLALEPPAQGDATGYGTVSVRPGPGGSREVRLETRGDERLLFRVEPRTGTGPLTRGDGAAAGERRVLFRLLEDRLLRWRAGVLEVSDAWSRLRVGFPASDTEGLEALFGPPAPGPLPETPGEPLPAPTLAVYHAVAASPERLAPLLSDPGLHAALLPEGWTVEGLTRHEGGFERSLVGEGRLLRRERVTRVPDGVTVEAEGPLALFRERTWRLEPRPTGARLRLLAVFRDPVPPRGLPEGTRRRLVFELASELLALDRATEGG